MSAATVPKYPLRRFVFDSGAPPPSKNREPRRHVAFPSLRAKISRPLVGLPERDLMGHAHHFLSRLDRVSLPQVELALSLYRDVELLRYVLANARLPEGAPRAAIALEHDESAPCIVVTREGRFVTCLGQGMRRGDLPVITRGQLDGIAARAFDLRARIEVCQKIVGRTGGVGKLLGRIHEAGDELSREELVALSALQPLYALELLHFLFAAMEDLSTSRQILLRQLRRNNRLGASLWPAARSYWNTFWAIGHLSLLTAMEGPGLLERLPAELGERLTDVSFSWGAVRQGVASLALKGVWAGARLGKAFLPAYKHMYREANSELSVADSGMGLVALGTRHSRLRAEVKKVLIGGPELDLGAKRGPLVRDIANLLVRVVDMDEKAPEELARLQRAHGARLCVAAVRDLPHGDPSFFERTEDVPEELAMTMAVNAVVPFIGHERWADVLLSLFGAVPWVARAAPEALYLPHDFIQATRTPWSVEATCGLLRAQRDHYKAPAHQNPGPSRNGPCPCGSGKKYKRCCGAD